MSKNKFQITAKQDVWGGAMKKGESIMVESQQSSQPTGLELRSALISKGKSVPNYSDTLTAQSFDIRKL